MGKEKVKLVLAKTLDDTEKKNIKFMYLVDKPINETENKSFNKFSDDLSNGIRKLYSISDKENADEKITIVKFKMYTYGNL